MGSTNGVAFVEVIGTEILVGGGPLQHVVAGGKDRVSNGNQGTLGASQCSQPPELRLQVSPFGFGCGPGSFKQGSPQPGSAGARGPALACPTGLIVARTDPCPTHYVSSRWKGFYRGTHFGDQRPSKTMFDARNCYPSVDCALKRS